MMLLYKILVTFYILALTVNFSHDTYFVNENNMSVQAMLILSNPSSRDIVVQVDTIDNNATGKLWISCSYHICIVFLY